MYIIAEANNIETDIFTTDIYVNKKEARKILSSKYKDVLDTIGDYVEIKEKSRDNYSVMTYNGDFYYGVINETHIS